MLLELFISLSKRRVRAACRPRAAGSADLCFIVDDPLDRAEAQLRALGIDIIEGPVTRTGAEGRLLSLYFRDIDGNLVEISNYARD